MIVIKFKKGDEILFNPSQIVYARRVPPCGDIQIHPICLESDGDGLGYSDCYSQVFNINQEKLEEDIDHLWSRIKTGMSDRNSNMISFEFVGLEENSNGQIHFEADTISGFKRTPAGIVLFFHDPSIADMPIKKGETRESLDDIWQQLCEAKGIETEVKQ